MFYGCSSLTTLPNTLPKLEEANYMFCNCGFGSFNTTLKTVKNANYMFMSCNSMETFTSDLSSDGDTVLQSFSYPFLGCTSLKHYNANTDVSDKDWHFVRDGLQGSLETFKGNLHKIKNAS